MTLSIQIFLTFIHFSTYLLLPPSLSIFSHPSHFSPPPSYLYLGRAKIIIVLALSDIQVHFPSIILRNSISLGCDQNHAEVQL